MSIGFRRVLRFFFIHSFACLLFCYHFESKAILIFMWLQNMLELSEKNVRYIFFTHLYSLSFKFQIHRQQWTNTFEWRRDCESELMHNKVLTTCHQPLTYRYHFSNLIDESITEKRSSLSTLSFNVVTICYLCLYQFSSGFKQTAKFPSMQQLPMNFSL